jgi:hypothetical protein
MDQRWNDTDRGKPKDLEQNLSRASSSITNPTRTDLGAIPGARGVKPATNCLSCVTAFLSLGSDIFRSSPFSDTAHLNFQSFTAIQTTGKIIVLCI